MAGKKRRDKYTEESQRKSSDEEQSPTEDEARILGDVSKGEEEETDLQNVENRNGNDNDSQREETERSPVREKRTRKEKRRTRERTRSRSLSRERSRDRYRSQRRSRHRSRDRYRSRDRVRSRSRERSRYGSRDRYRDDPHRIIGDITEYFDNKFTSLRRELIEEHDSITERLDKKFKPEREFKRKTNKYQYEHNNEMTAAMKKAKKNLQKKAPNVKKAVQVLESGIVANNFRTKCILIADKSEGGWATVEEYLQRELASDSEDDKRLRKAEQASARTLENKKKKFKPRYKPYNNRRNNWNQNNYNNNNRYNNDQGYYNQNHEDYPYNRRNRGSGGRRYEQGCFICGDFGHWKEKCPRKWSASAGSPRDA